MTLKDSVQIVIDDMEKRLKDTKEFYADSVQGWILALKIALKSSPEANPYAPPAGMNLDPRTAELVQRASVRRQAKQGAPTITRTNEMPVPDENTYGPNMATCVDGPEKGTSILVNPSVREGDAYQVGRTEYEYRQGKLYSRT